MKRCRVDFKPGKPGGNVAVLISLVDRGRGDPRNILDMTVHRDLDTYIYKITFQAGVLNGWRSRDQFDLCTQNLLT